MNRSDATCVSISVPYHWGDEKRSFGNLRWSAAYGRLFSLVNGGPCGRAAWVPHLTAASQTERRPQEVDFSSPRQPGGAAVTYTRTTEGAVSAKRRATRWPGGDCDGSLANSSSPSIDDRAPPVCLREPVRTRRNNKELSVMATVLMDLSNSKYVYMYM